MLVYKAAFIPSFYHFSMADVTDIFGCVRPCTTRVTCATVSQSYTDVLATLAPKVWALIHKLESELS